MSGETNINDCGGLLDYISGACTEEEKAAFEAHLQSCGSCRQELAEWQIVWEALPTDMDLLEPPRDLKERIMTAAKAAPRRRGSKVSGWRKPALAVAAAAVVFCAGTLWPNPWIEREPAVPTIEQALEVPASQIVQLNMLKAEPGGKTNAYGVACIVDNGQSRQFVVYVFGAQETKDEEAYQVWLVRDGVRTSAGTFRVDDKGVGLLTMAVGAEELAYDRIGITLEPDEWGDRPRGPKAFGTEAVL
ncbi:anti-sigma factor [Paenibacillus sp. N4]|uniref:anti-sigma factor n=1 Tax=Paenibacillus vietnamensis TaxID=2590547 RepID=UPI001CD0ED1C|nr:anti-sigma factor [Paenibacillus vietnamensis]MCA0758215.1 anti-sigma factor [Paenibacillus vietnamensis]